MGFAFLSRPRREAMLVLYAFCREVDDVVDDCSDPQVAEATLNWWQEQLELVYTASATPEHPVCQAMVTVVRKFHLPQEEFLAILDGMAMDLSPARYANFEQLALYCHHVAGVVGRLITRILGFQNQETLAYAEKMGLALQLTNIIRDVGDDARIGRIYLPLEDLERFSVPQTQILRYQGSPEFKALMDFQVERALAVYQDAVATLPKEDRRTQKAGLVMGAIYYKLLLTLQEDGVEKVLQQKLSLSGSQKLVVAFKTLLFGFQP